MSISLTNKLARIFAAITIAAIIAFSLPQPTFAAVDPGKQSETNGGYITFPVVRQDNMVTVKATYFPANEDFTIRVGPFYNFWKKVAVVGTVNSGSGGTFTFNVDIPDDSKGSEWISVRLDGSKGTVVYNAFKNVNTGTSVPTTPPQTGKCQITSTRPNANLSKKADFDAVWTVKNTGTKTWDMSAVDYKYLSGTKMQKRASVYDLPKSVKPGQSIKIVVDMIAPNKVGTFTTTWGIVQGNSTLCKMPLTITVR
jgi:hypothetical protein